MTRLARRFAQRLEGRFELPVALVDERYTLGRGRNPRPARRREEQARVDAVAAQIILQEYFDDQLPDAEELCAQLAAELQAAASGRRRAHGRASTPAAPGSPSGCTASSG